MFDLHGAGATAEWLIGNHKCLLITLKICGIKSKAVYTNIGLLWCSATVLEVFSHCKFSGVGVCLSYLLSFSCGLTAQSSMGYLNK